MKHEQNDCGMIRRSFPCEIRSTEDPNLVELSASSEFAVQRGRYREILLHGKKNVKNIAQTALFNHNPDMVIGAIREAGIAEDKTIRAKVQILDGARLPSGVLASDAVKTGALRGVSIGYSIDKYEHEERDGITEIRATEWTLREISLTPIPADPTVGVGRSEDDAAFVRFIETQKQEEPANKERAAMSEPTKPESQVAAATVQPQIDIAAIRAEAVAIASQAESLGLRAADFAGMPKAEAQAAMLEAVAKRDAKKPAPTVQVIADQQDKLVRHTAQRLLDGDGLWAVREFAEASGQRFTSNSALFDWTLNNLRGNLIDMKLVRQFKKSGKADIDNVRAAETSANFTMVAGLAATKLAFDGFTSYKPWSDAVLTKGTANDFKTIRTGSLQMGDFSSPSEGSAFSDLTIDDAGGSGSLTMRGAGIELTKQALYNDELGLFLERIKKVGYLAAQHQDKLAATAIPGATWTAATTALALSGTNLKTAWANFMAITGPAGEKPGYVPRKILVPSALYITALELTTLAQGSTTENPLATNSNANPGKMPLEVVHGLHLSDANDWFILADPMEASGFTYFTHPDYAIPQMIEVDAGLVASRKFRIEYPSAIVVSHLNPGTNTKPVGAYQCTQA